MKDTEQQRNAQQTLKNENIVKYIKLSRIRWLGHVERMNEERMYKHLMLARMKGTRRRGRPRNRWLDEIRKDL